MRKSPRNPKLCVTAARPSCTCEIHVEAAQLKFLWYPAGAYDYSGGYVALQNVFLPGLRCNAALTGSLSNLC